MNLLQEIEEEERASRRIECPIYLATESMNDEEQKNLALVLAGKSRSSVIERVLRKHYPMGEGAVASHRGGRCSCRGSC